MTRYSGVLRAAELLFAGCIFSLGLLVARAEAASKPIPIECTAQKAIDITVPPDEESVSFTFTSECFCDRSAEKLKSLASSGQIAAALIGGGSFSIKPGDPELTLYCYSRSMLNLGPRR
jgi:hypothetical protein